MEKICHSERMLSAKTQNDAKIKDMKITFTAIINENLEEINHEELQLEEKLKTAKLAYNTTNKDFEQKKETIRLTHEKKIDEYKAKQMVNQKEQKRILDEKESVFNSFQKEQDKLLNEKLDEGFEKVSFKT